MKTETVQKYQASLLRALGIDPEGKLAITELNLKLTLEEPFGRVEVKGFLVEDIVNNAPDFEKITKTFKIEVSEQ